MILHSLCNSCFQVFEIRTEPGMTHLLKELLERGTTCDCPRLCGGKINLVESPNIENLSNDPRLKTPLVLTVWELYRAVNGFGLPDEISNSPELVEALFKAYDVVRVSLQQDGSRIYLHEIEFQNGSTLHLSAGSRGAQVLKITRKEK